LNWCVDVPLFIGGSENGKQAEETMKRSMVGFCFCLATVLAITISSTTISAPGDDTCVGSGATIGGTCTPLTNTTSDNKDNTALGAAALASNTTGNNNTAIGASALNSNTSGVDNNASGISALSRNTIGNLNTGDGAFALAGNTTGNQNTATGFDALVQNTTGNSNTAGGASALFSNTTGDNNTASGVSAMFGNVSGSLRWRDCHRWLTMKPLNTGWVHPINEAVRTTGPVQSFTGALNNLRLCQTSRV
jgi:hypothetical protein